MNKINTLNANGYAEAPDEISVKLVMQSTPPAPNYNQPNGESWFMYAVCLI